MSGAPEIRGSHVLRHHRRHRLRRRKRRTGRRESRTGRHAAQLVGATHVTEPPPSATEAEHPAGDRGTGPVRPSSTPPRPVPSISDPDHLEADPSVPNGHGGAAGASSAGTDADSVGATVGTMFGRDSLYMVASSLNLLAGVLVTPVMTRVLGLHQYGIFASRSGAPVRALLHGESGLEHRHPAPVQRRGRGAQEPEPARHVDRPRAQRHHGDLPDRSTVESPSRLRLAFPLSTRLTTIWSGFFALTWICLAILRCNERLPGVHHRVPDAGDRRRGRGHPPTPSSTDWPPRYSGGVGGSACAAGAVAGDRSPPLARLYNFRTVWTTLRFSIPIVPLQISTFVLSASDRFVILPQRSRTGTHRPVPGRLHARRRRHQHADLPQPGVAAPDLRHQGPPPPGCGARPQSGRALPAPGPGHTGYRPRGPHVALLWAPASFHTDSLVPGHPGGGLDHPGVHLVRPFAAPDAREGRSGIVAIVTVWRRLDQHRPQPGHGAAPQDLRLGTGHAHHLRRWHSAWSAFSFGSCLRLPRPPLVLWAQLAGVVVVIFASRSIPTHGIGAVVRLVGAGV